MFKHYVFENDQGSWSLVDSKMEHFLNSQRDFLIGPGINTAELFPPTGTTVYGIASHLSDGMSGHPIWVQYNIETGRSRILSRIQWDTIKERDRILQNGSMISKWKEKIADWIPHDLNLFRNLNSHKFN